MTLGDLKEAIKEQYPIINDEIISRLVFCHYKHIGKDATKKAVYITDDDELLPGKVQMETGGYTLMVRYKGLKMKKGKKAKKGDSRMEDVSCDSDYMMDVMPKVGRVSCCAVRPAADGGPARPRLQLRPPRRLHATLIPAPPQRQRRRGGTRSVVQASTTLLRRRSRRRRAMDRQRTMLMIVASLC